MCIRDRTLGVQLVNRSTRKVGLAEAGREFYPLAARLLQDLDGALETMADLKALKRGLVRIAAPQLLSGSVLPAAMAGFRQDVYKRQTQWRYQSALTCASSFKVFSRYCNTRRLLSG